MSTVHGININSNTSQSYTSHYKSCFYMILLFNVLFAFVYFIYEQNQINRVRDKIFYKGFSATNGVGPSQSTINSNNVIKYIRNILKTEYNQKDLTDFYDLVQKEFSLGLRCTRSSTQPTAFPVSNNTIVNATANRSLTENVYRGKQISRKISYSRLRRQNFYSFRINNTDQCNNESIDLLIIIVSKSENYKTRDAIRRTWGSSKNIEQNSSIQVKIFFLIDFDDKLSHNIRLENNLFNDIIQVELPQQYTLVTHRVLALFEWSFLYCRTAKFLFKTDDDIFINFILLLRFVSSLNYTNEDDRFRISHMQIYGYKHYNPGVFRHSTDLVGLRYDVTLEEYPCSKYPDFLSGFGYLIPKKARDALVYASYHDRNTPFRISDVYLTGILPDYLSLRRQPMLNYNIRYTGSCDNFFEQSNAFACAAGSHHGDTSDVFNKFHRYWNCIRKHF